MCRPGCNAGLCQYITNRHAGPLGIANRLGTPGQFARDSFNRTQFVAAIAGAFEGGGDRDAGEFALQIGQRQHQGLLDHPANHQAIVGWVDHRDGAVIANEKQVKWGQFRLAEQIEWWAAIKWLGRANDERRMFATGHVRGMLLHATSLSAKSIAILHWGWLCSMRRRTN